MKWILTLVVPALLLGCAHNEEDDLSKAQTCLDNVPQSDPSQADSCMQYVEKYDSQAANILKCSIVMTGGGLVESKVLQAYKALTDSSETNKAAAFMAVLSLNLPTIDAALTRAQTANGYCQQTGVTGLVYISSIVLAGTAMNSTLYHLTGGTGSGTGIDISSAASIEAATANLIAKCSASPPDSACTANLPIIGQAVSTLASSYCGTSGADATVCSQVEPAVAAAGGDPTQVGQALFCYLESKTYNATTQACQ